MGKFILIDFKKREEVSALNKLGPAICLKMDKWIKEFENDGTPPNEEEAAVLEAEKMAELLLEFDTQAEKLWRAKDKVPNKRAVVGKQLNQRKGRLFAKYSDDVAALQDQAAMAMTYCKETYESVIEGLDQLIPTKESDITSNFEGLLKNCTEYIEASYPEGVAGIDSYDDDFPDGLMSFQDFQEMLKLKEAEYMEKNQAAIAPTVEKIKERTKDMVKAKINEAIEQARKEIEEDLSDDVLPYLDEEAMSALRQSLIEQTNSYAKSRMDE